MRRFPLVFFLLAAGLALVPAPASAITIDEVVSLTEAGVSDQVIVAMIDRDQTIFSIDADGLIALRSAGVSEPVLLAMLRSGRAQTPAAPAAQTADPILPPPADLVIVGHGPDAPDTGIEYRGPVVAFVPLVVPLAVGGSRRAQGHRGRPVFPATGAFVLPDSGLPPSPFHVGPELLPSPFHVGPELPPSPFHVGPIFKPFVTSPRNPPQD